MAEQLIGTNYVDMDDAYKASIEEAEYDARKNAQLTAAERAKKYQSGEKAMKETDVYDVKDLNDFDLRAHGAGGALNRKYNKEDDQTFSNATYGKGEARLSRQDVKELWKSGNHTIGELEAFAEGLGDKGIYGDKAQAFLARKKAKYGADVTRNQKNGENGGAIDNPAPGDGGGTTPPPPGTDPEEASTTPAPVAVNDSGNSGQNRNLTGGTVNVGGDNNGMIDNSVNDHSFNLQMSGGAGKGGLGGNVLSAGIAHGMNDWVYHKGQKYADDHYNAMRFMQGKSDLAASYGAAADGITSHFANLGTLSGYGLDSTYDTIAGFKAQPSDPIEPDYGDDDD